MAKGPERSIFERVSSTQLSCLKLLGMTPKALPGSRTNFRPAFIPPLDLLSRFLPFLSNTNAYDPVCLI